MAKSEERERASQLPETKDFSTISTIFRFSGVGILRLNKRGRLLEGNHALEKILGYSIEILKTMVPADLVHPEDMGKGRVQYRALLRGKCAYFVLEQRYRRADGKTVWCHLTVSRIGRSKGPPQSVFVILEDITVRKELDLALAERAEALALSNRELNLFAFTASHDLNEPLDKIIAFGKLLDQECGGDLNESGKEYLDYMQDAARRMQDLITSLLELSQVTSHDRPFIAVDLNKILKTVLSDFHFRIEEFGVRVVTETLPVVLGDPIQLHQLLQNLIGNALKFRLENKPPEIKVLGIASIVDDELPERKLCAFQVCDNGIGFDNIHMDRIFHPFQRLHPRGSFEGTGNGLAICRKIVERHEGRIYARGKPGEGAVFSVVLPIWEVTENK